MKLYIPSCTLNFNNIFTTESISPKSFYAKRGFGNKRYYGVEANDMEDVILLYSKYPIFQIKESDLENYPIVIEIETSDYRKGKFHSVKSKDGVDVYSCSDTVYLNPFHCRVYFGSYAERQGVLTKADQSLENKFYKLYSSGFLIKQAKTKGLLDKVGSLFSSRDDEVGFKWNASYCPAEVQSEPINREEDDAVVDRIKGFLYCYLIGANTTVSQDVADLQSVARKLRNTIAAAFNTPGHVPTDSQDASLLEDIKSFNNLYSKTDEAMISNREKINNLLANNQVGLSVEKGVEFLKFCNVYSDFCAKLGLQPTYDANELWNCFEDKSTVTFNHVVEGLRIAVSRVVAREMLKSNKRNLNELAEVSRDHVLLIKDLPNKKFYEKLVQSLIFGEYKKIIEENGVELPLAIAYKGGAILKDIMGGDWERSSVRTYIGNLLNHFQESTYFDLFAISYDVPVSFAAFCQKGDSVDRLLDYLEQCGIRNAKLALGLHGATYGFASLPKTFTSKLIDGDKEYYKDVYLYIYKNLFGIELSNATFPNKRKENENDVAKSSIDASSVGKNKEIEPKSSKKGSIANVITDAVRTDGTLLCPREFMSIADGILNKTNAYKALKEAGFEKDTNEYALEVLYKRVVEIITPKLPKDKKSKDNILDKVRQIIKLQTKVHDKVAFISALDEFLKPTDSAYKNVVKLVCSPSPSVKEERLPSKRKDIISDAKAVEVIQSCKELGNYRETIVDMFVEFQREYQSGFYYKNPQKYERNNEAVVDHFCNSCLSTRKNKHIPTSQETRNMMEILKEKLKAIYNDR